MSSHCYCGHCNVKVCDFCSGLRTECLDQECSICHPHRKMVFNVYRNTRFAKRNYDCTNIAACLPVEESAKVPEGYEVAPAAMTLPRCQHGGCLVDGSGERLEPPCGCRPTDAHDYRKAQLILLGVRVAAERAERLRIVAWIDQQMLDYGALPRYGATDNSMFLEHCGRMKQMTDIRRWILSAEDEKS